MRKGKSKKLTEAQVVEPLTKDIKPDVEKQDHERRKSLQIRMTHHVELPIRMKFQ